MSKAKSKEASTTKTNASQVVDLVLSQCELVHDQQKEPCAIIRGGGVRQILNLNGKGFRDWLSSTFYQLHHSSLSEATINNALATVSGKALFQGKMVKTHIRIAKTEDAYWIDLCNDQWEAVKVTSSGWEVLAGNAVPLFCRSASMQAIPRPIDGGSLQGLWQLVNIPAPDQLMVVTWLLECLREETPHVVLELVGEQGSAKSTTQRLLRMLIDPNLANLRAAPKKVEDVWVSAGSSHLVSFENISGLNQDYQDALCVMATGGAFATRKLYTNGEESIINLRKPIVINGISSNVTAQDLLDRSLHLELPRVQTRLQSKEVDEAFERQYPQFVGALLDEFVKALAALDDVHISDENKPRMLDFAYLGEAVYRANGLPDGSFIDRYHAMRGQGVQRTLDSSPVAVALLDFLEANSEGWSGRLIDLLALLAYYKPVGETNWPRSPKSLGDVLRRLAPALRMLGFECRAGQKQSGQILWSVRPVDAKLSNQCPSSPSSPSPLAGVLAQAEEGQDMQDMQDLEDMENTVSKDEAPAPIGGT